MSEDGSLHIDTLGTTTAAEHEHHVEDVKRESVTLLDAALESSSEESDQSGIFDGSDKTTCDLCPTTPVHPENHDHDFQDDNLKLSTLGSDAGAEKPSQGPSLSGETDTKSEHLNKKAADEIPTPVLVAAEQPHKEPVQDPPHHRPSHEHGGEESSAAAEPESSEEENVEEKHQKTPMSTIAGAEETSEELASHPAETESKSVLGEETRKSSGSDENALGELADKEDPESTPPTSVAPEITTETRLQESSPLAQDQEPLRPPTPSASKEACTTIQSEREKRAFDVVKQSRNQFRVTLNVFLQLITENEDDEGVVRFNLVARDSDLRKAVEMLGMKLQGLAEAERDLDHAKLLARYEAKTAQESS